METNSFEYDRSLQWTPQQDQFYQNKSVGAKNEQQLSQSQNLKLPQRGVGQRPGAQVKMPKARARALANSLKRFLAIASMISFGMFGGLVAMHQVGTTTQSTQSTSGSSNTSSKSSPSSQNSTNFFNQQGGNTSGTSSTSSSNSSSTPVTGTSTS